MVYAVIMAGGRGTSFWPVSTPEKPQQIHKLFEREESMIFRTVNRLLPTIPLENQRIVTLDSQKEDICLHLGDSHKVTVIGEPYAKNTAPCIGLAAMRLLKEDDDPVMVVLPSDHQVEDEEAFREALEKGIRFVEETSAIVAIGVEPDRPETNYGYIQFERDAFRDDVHRIVAFAEKPNRATAERFLRTKEFLWNTGIYIWPVKRILSEIEEYLPELYAALMEIGNSIGEENEAERIRRAYSSIRPISIDYGVMERTQSAYVVPGDFKWKDVGDWEEMYRSTKTEKDDEKNLFIGNVQSRDTTGSLVICEDGADVTVIGLNDVVVVHTSEGTLVCPRERAAEVHEAAEVIFRERQKQH